MQEKKAGIAMERNHRFERFLSLPTVGSALRFVYSSRTAAPLRYRFGDTPITFLKAVLK